ncbi:unnamed protein product, partial [Tetraodon nigroviridis]
SHLFYQNRQEKFISRLAGNRGEELPKKAESVTPCTMALIAKYVARHRLRDARLLDTIADFLVKKAEFLDSKVGGASAGGLRPLPPGGERLHGGRGADGRRGVLLCPQVIQKLVFPFSRMSYRPSNQQQFFSRLEEVVELKALSSPLATVNILMSLFQLGHFPGSGAAPRLLLRLHQQRHQQPLRADRAPLPLSAGRRRGAGVPGVLRTATAGRPQDEVNRKYSYKGLVAEALRQLLGEHKYRQDQVLPPGYYTDFLLWMNGPGQVLPIRT